MRTAHEIAVTDARRGIRARPGDAIAVPTNPYVIAAGRDALFVASTGRGMLTRIRP